MYKNNTKFIIRKRNIFFVTCILLFIFLSCTEEKKKTDTKNQQKEKKELSLKEKINQYVLIELKPNLNNLSKKELKALYYLIEAAEAIDEIFWKQTCCLKDTLFQRLKTKEESIYVAINYGPWDRLKDNEPFIEGIGKKPIGAGFFPPDIKYFPFLSLKAEDKISQYTVIKKDEFGDLYTLPYHKEYAEELSIASNSLLKAAEYIDNIELKRFLRKRAESLLNDDYYTSDLLWMELEPDKCKIDIVIGPVNTEDDCFLNTKTTYEAYILLCYPELTKKYNNFSKLLNEMIKEIPLPENYINKIVVGKSKIGVYDGIYFSGWPNAGAKQISINYPKDIRIKIEKGHKKLMFKNIMEAKFYNVLLPLAKTLLQLDSTISLKFEAFFINGIAYEFADATIVKETVNKKGPAKEALKDYYPVINSLKSDFLYIFLITKLHEKGLVKETSLKEHYYTYVANLLRSIRFGSVVNQGSSSLIAFNMLRKFKAIELTENGKYFISVERMKEVINKLTKDVFKLLAEGDIPTAKQWLQIYGSFSEEIYEKMDLLSKNNIPVDIRYKQGKEVLNLQLQ